VSVVSEIACPECGALGPRGLMTRREGTGIGTIRRHQCRPCGYHFYTFQPDPIAIQSHQIQWSERIPWLRQP